MSIQSADFGRSAFAALPDGLMETVSDGQSILTGLLLWHGLSCNELSERSGVDLIIIMLAERGGALMREEKQAIAKVLAIDPAILP
jgi:hypothetical protein